MSTEVVGFVGFSRHRPSFTLETVLNLQSRSSEVFPMAVASSVLDLIGSTPVSYTHLTLPTKRIV